MRTAKYYDYTVLRIILFIILVIVGLFLYFKFVKSPCDHVPTSDGWIVSDPTCTEDGYRYKVCAECGEQFDNQTIDALGHKPTEAVKENETAATCTAEGAYDNVVYCQNCQTELSRETISVPMTEHTYGEWTTTKEPTATEDGVKTRTCVCGAEETEAIPALGVEPTEPQPTDPKPTDPKPTDPKPTESQPATQPSDSTEPDSNNTGVIIAVVVAVVVIGGVVAFLVIKKKK